MIKIYVHSLSENRMACRIAAKKVAIEYSKIQSTDKKSFSKCNSDVTGVENAEIAQLSLKR